MAQFAAYVSTSTPRDLSTIVEIGSHDARDALILRTLFPWMRCVAIEGDPQNYARQSTASLQAQGVEWVHAVVGSESTPSEWWTQPHALMICGVYNRGLPGAYPQPCTVERFDALAQRIGLLSASVVKVDVEGATLDVLQGFGDLIRTVKWLHLETETEPYFAGATLEPAVFAWLREHGFDMRAHDPDQGQADSVWAGPTA